jgi:hypothetical protein
MRGFFCYQKSFFLPQSTQRKNSEVTENFDHHRNSVFSVNTSVISVVKKQLR